MHTQVMDTTNESIAKSTNVTNLKERECTTGLLTFRPSCRSAAFFCCRSITGKCRYIAVNYTQVTHYTKELSIDVHTGTDRDRDRDSHWVLCLHPVNTSFGVSVHHGIGVFLLLLLLLYHTWWISQVHTWEVFAALHMHSGDTLRHSPGHSSFIHHHINTIILRTHLLCFYTPNIFIVRISSWYYKRCMQQNVHFLNHSLEMLPDRHRTHEQARIANVYKSLLQFDTFSCSSFPLWSPCGKKCTVLTQWEQGMSSSINSCLKYMTTNTQIHYS